MPTHNWGRNLVAKRIAENGGMTCAGTHASSYIFLYGLSTFSIIKEGDVLLPGQTYHNAEAVSLCNVEKPARRHSVCADCIHTICRNLGKISLYNL